MEYKRFSEREGFVKVRDEIQVEFMTIELRNSLWNIIIDQYHKRGMQFDKIFTSMWINLFKEPIDEVSNNPSKRLNSLRQIFFGQVYNVVYDIIEFFANYMRGLIQTEFIDNLPKRYATICFYRILVQRSAGLINRKKLLSKFPIGTASRNVEGVRFFVNSKNLAPYPCRADSESMLEKPAHNH